MRRLCFLLASLALAGHAAAQAYRPDFDPGAYKGAASGPANELLVLGTPHLSTFPDGFDPANLRLLNERLAAWHPQAIAIEALSGPQCDFLRRYPAPYKDTVATYCWDPAPARAATGLDVAAATMEAERLLASWPAMPSPSQRRHLAAVFLAGGEQASALVQWLRLSEAQRRSGDGLDGALAERLRMLQAKRNESYMIAAQLAARLGHELVYAMDDHSADFEVKDEEGFKAAIIKAWANPANKQRKEEDSKLRSRIDTPDGLLALYQAYNGAGVGKVAFDSDFGAALQDPSPGRFGRRYVGFWETRNLRMAANIRYVMENRPGIRMLVVVGASHKGYLEAYLQQMHDVRVVDAMAVLR